MKKVGRFGKRGRREAAPCGWVVLAVWILLAAAGCQWFGDSREYVATVDGMRISLREFNTKMEKKLSLLGNWQTVSESQVEALKREVLGELVDERVLLNQAERLRITVSDDELQKRIGEIKKDYGEESFEQLFRDRTTDYRTWVEELRKRLLLERLIQQEVNAKISVTDAEVATYYEGHARERVSPERVRLSQIVLQDREKAEAVLRRLKNGEDFAAVAREVSSGPEAEKGGDLGFFTRGVLPETFDEVVFSLPPGRISRVVETPYGYHVFKVLEREKGGTVRLDEARETIRAKLKHEKEDQEYGRWLGLLRSAAVVKVNEAVWHKSDERKDRPAGS